jgi:hypothetical protein
MTPVKHSKAAGKSEKSGASKAATKSGKTVKVAGKKEPANTMKSSAKSASKHK